MFLQHDRQADRDDHLRDQADAAPAQRAKSPAVEERTPRQAAEERPPTSASANRGTDAPATLSRNAIIAAERDHLAVGEVGEAVVPKISDRPTEHMAMISPRRMPSARRWAQLLEADCWTPLGSRR